MRKNLHILLLLLICYFHGISQSYRITKYGIADGLLSNDCGGIIQDSSGYLWVSNGNIISRFDGYSFKSYELKGGGNFFDDLRLGKKNEVYFQVGLGFVKYQKENDFFDFKNADTNALKVYGSNGDFRGMRAGGLMDKSGNIWYNNGIHIYLSDRKSTNIFTIPGLENMQNIKSFFLNNEGVVCILVKNGIYINNGKTFDFTQLDNVGLYKNLFIDSKKRKFFYGQDGDNLTLYLNNKKQNITIDKITMGKFSGAILEDEKGDIWMGFSKAIGKLVNNKIEWAAFPKEIVNIKLTQKGNLIFTSKTQCFVWDKGEIIRINPSLENTEIKLSYMDTENNIWLTTSNGLFKCRPTNISNYSLNDITKNAIQLKNDEKLTIQFVDNQNRYWIFKTTSEITLNYNTIRTGNYYLQNEKGELKKLSELSNVWKFRINRPHLTALNSPISTASN